MSGLKVNKMTRSQVLEAVRAIPSEHDFVWDGQDDDDRPLTKEEMQVGLVARKPGRPVGSDKISTTIRFDADVVMAFRAGGRGWQSRMNAALKDWLRTHSAEA